MPGVTGPEPDIKGRKADHIRINLEQDVRFPTLTSGLERYRFMHQALPELDLDSIDTRIEVLGKGLQAPLLISSMTGGTEEAAILNRRLAAGAQRYGLAMGLGSQRAAIEEPDLARTFQVREVAPDILLFANLGAVQLNYGYGIDQCRRAVEMIGADALYLHFNVLQEAVQAGGDTRWAGLMKKIESVARALEVPVIAKEVGWGFSPQAARDLASAGVTGIDVAGSGGTSWSEVEYHRAPSSFHAKVARSFADWGIPTADSLEYVRSAAPNLLLIASGGLTNGIDVAKSIALGARLGGMAGPMLRAAAHGEEAMDEMIRITLAQLRIAMLAAGCADIAALSQVELLRVEAPR